MTMKKRFLGLALAAMVAVPATTAYANSYQTVEGDENKTLSHKVKVSGTVNTNTGTAPSGKIQVELPTAMAFTVSEDSTLTGGTYNVENRSSVPITLSVSEFRRSTGNITVEDTESFNQAEQDRSHVFLSLDGRVAGVPTSVDLGSFIAGEILADVEILDVDENNSATMTLSGEAGTKPDSSGTVDSKGATGEFDLVFKISKDASR